MDLPEKAVQRRRGAALETALLDAAWDELFEVGYAALTMEGVAQRAGTSRPVLYRRWATKADLVLAAVLHHLPRGDLELPDTGSLRDDLAAIMRHGRGHRFPLSAELLFHLGAYFAETGTSPADFRRALIGDQPTFVDLVFDRAVERGEVDGERLTRRRRDLAFDLFRHESLMTLQPVPDEVIDAILDDVVVPLLGLSPR